MSYIKHRPTVLDQVPMDVIRYHIFPLLDFDSRINLNQCLPRWDRVPKKFDKEFLETHERDVCVSTLRGYLCAIEDMPGGCDKRFKKIKKMFKLLQTPTYIAFVNKNPGFRRAVVAKVVQMRNPETYYGVGGSLEAKVALIKETKKLQALLEASAT